MAEGIPNYNSLVGQVLKLMKKTITMIGNSAFPWYYGRLTAGA